MACGLSFQCVFSPMKTMGITKFWAIYGEIQPLVPNARSGPLQLGVVLVFIHDFGKQYFSECPQFTYGTGCEQQCGHCKNNETCDTFTGLCKRGCHNEYHGSFCTMQSKYVYIYVHTSHLLHVPLNRAFKKKKSLCL